MRRFVLFKTILVLALAVNANANIGNVTELNGTAAVFRNQVESPAALNFDIESYDEVKTALGRIALEFLDDSTLKLTEHSAIVIDDFVYDPDPNKSKLALTFTSGTTRFITGALGAINKDNIKLKTPTAEIAIRGTDFTSTVDELGRTLIILLPDEFGISSGEIIVSSLGGSVTLNKPYQATTVNTADSSPSTPKILDLTLSIIDNMLIVSPPKEVKVVDEGTQEKKETDFLGFEELDKDLLKDQLEEEEVKDFTELDIDFLNVDLLTDLLDNFEELEEEKEGDLLRDNNSVEIIGTLIGYDSKTQINTFIDNEFLVLYQKVSNSTRLELNKGYGYNLVLNTEGKTTHIIVNEGTDNYIRIKQQ